MDVRALTTEAERRRAVPVLRQLWADRSPEEVLAWTGDEDYHLFGGFVDGEVVAAAGVLETGVLHHARHAWIYDLVVDEAHRGEGLGSALVAFVEEWAADAGCECVALASPLSKTDAHAFYADLDYERWGYVLETEL